MSACITPAKFWFLGYMASRSDTLGQVVEYIAKFHRLVIDGAQVVPIQIEQDASKIMLKCDGFSPRERLLMNLKGLPWFFGKNGTLTAMKKQYMDWFKKDFHPSQHPVIRQYPVWIETLEKTNDPIAAGEAFWQAGL